VNRTSQAAGSPFERHRHAVRRRLLDAGASPRESTVSRQVNREIVAVAGWGRAILLQFAHPLVAAGVAGHSAFGGSLPAALHRLRSTVGAKLSLTCGPDEEALAAAAGINTIHDRINGRLPAAAGRFAAGTPYSAHDPELLRWVHATLLESIPMTYELLVGPLAPAERDLYCEEAAVTEPLLDIPAGSLPRSTAQLAAYMRAMHASGAITVTDTSRALAREVLFPPQWYLLWPALRPVQLITIGLLPPAIREAYGFRWHARDARAFIRWATAIRRVQGVLPPIIRHWPVARRAEARGRFQAVHAG
jgi:uncharacterized protein (DUF2236 family)